MQDEDISEDDGDYDIYYRGENDDLDDGRGCHVGGEGSGSQFNNNDDPEYFSYSCLTVAEAKDLLLESVNVVCASVQISPAEAKIILNANRWNVEETLRYALSQQYTVLGGRTKIDLVFSVIWPRDLRLQRQPR